MKTSLARRIVRLEQNRGNSTRRVHIVIATDDADRDRQLAELVAAVVVHARDGFLCITGKPTHAEAHFSDRFRLLAPLQLPMLAPFTDAGLAP